jgi:phosphate/phosphite/phosphonate ABC transporter binding protein
VEITFGYFAQDKSASDILDDASERLRAWLSARLSVKLSLHFAGGYAALGQAMTDGLVDVAWLPPVVFAQMSRDRAEPLLALQRGGHIGYESVLLVRGDADIRALTDLRGKRAAWVDAWSASGFLVPRAGLLALGEDPRRLFRTEAFYGSHGAALKAVTEGRADVLGTHARPRRLEDPRDEADQWAHAGGMAMRVLFSFGLLPPDLICVLPQLPQAMKSALRTAFVEGVAGPMKAEMKTIFGADGFASEYDPDGYLRFRKQLADATRAGIFT